LFWDEELKTIHIWGTNGSTERVQRVLGRLWSAMIPVMEFKTTRTQEETVMWNDARFRFSHLVPASCVLFEDEIHKRMDIPSSSSITLQFPSPYHSEETMFAVRILHTSPGSEKIIQITHHARESIAKFEEEACQIIMILNAFQYQYIIRDEILYNIQMRYGVYVDTQSSTNLQSSPPISRKMNVLLSAIDILILAMSHIRYTLSSYSYTSTYINAVA
jgi:hypothetical protein